MIPSERRLAWKRTQDLYHAARKLKPDARARFLAYQCAGDDETLAEVERLLAVAEDDDFLADGISETES